MGRLEIPVRRQPVQAGIYRGRHQVELRDHRHDIPAVRKQSTLLLKPVDLRLVLFFVFRQIPITLPGERIHRSVLAFPGPNNHRLVHQHILILQPGDFLPQFPFPPVNGAVLTNFTPGHPKAVTGHAHPQHTPAGFILSV